MDTPKPERETVDRHNRSKATITTADPKAIPPPVQESDTGAQPVRDASAGSSSVSARGEPVDHVPRVGESPPMKDAPAAVPRSFGRHEVCRVLGQGGFGTVYLGHDTQLNRPVAIKVLRGDSDMPREATDQFLAEARRVARLRHPGIVAVHDVGEQDGQVYVVWDFIEGTSLRDWIRKNRPLWQQSARIVAAIADALAHAHAQLTVHRDIKPANIIMTGED